MSKKVEFDIHSLDFNKVGRNIKPGLLHIFMFFVLSLLVAVVLYLLFAIFWRTDIEKQLKKEISMYKSIYPMFAPREELLGDALAMLQHKDDEIYEQIFHSQAPSLDPMGKLDFFYESDNVPDTKLTSYARDKSDRLLKQAANVDEVFEDIIRVMQGQDFAAPPMLLPLQNLSYPQIGASMGQKLNPFYRAYVHHNGLDMIVTRGTDVYATADGIVTSASNSSTLGNTVEIAHQAGYSSLYAHLERMSVRNGQSVKAGQVIGTVGMSGKAFAPHLHYEVHKNSVPVNPINYIFASVSPEEYTNMLFMSVNTTQSMD